MQPITVLFFGTQGAGKGTQVKMLLERLKSQSDRGIITIDMGQHLRNLRDTKTYTGTLVGTVIDAGARMLDFMPIYLQTKVFVEGFTGAEHIVADGLARGSDQTRAFDDMMKFYGRDLHIINLVISDDTAVSRLLARGRNDDTEEAIRNRLGWTKTDVMPQLQLLESRGRTIHTINGEQTIESAHQDILKALGLA
jgi:adenylate kinase